MEKSLYKKERFCKCYYKLDKNTNKEALIYEIETCGKNLVYTLEDLSPDRGYKALCNDKRFSFKDKNCETWKPQTALEWKKFCIDLGIKISKIVAYGKGIPNEYKVRQDLISTKTNPKLIFNGQILINGYFHTRGDDNPYVEPVLRLKNQDQKTMPYMELAKQNPEEYCIFVSELGFEDKMKIFTLEGKPVVERKIK